MNGIKQLPARALQGIGRRVVADSVSDLIQYRKAQARFQIRLCVGEGFQFLIRVTLALFPGLVGDGDREQAGPVIVIVKG